MSATDGCRTLECARRRDQPFSVACGLAVLRLTKALSTLLQASSSPWLCIAARDRVIDRMRRALPDLALARHPVQTLRECVSDRCHPFVRDDCVARLLTSPFVTALPSAFNSRVCYNARSHVCFAAGRPARAAGRCRTHRAAASLCAGADLDTPRPTCRPRHHCSRRLDRLGPCSCQCDAVLCSS